MAIAVSTLGEPLVTQRASKGSQALMGTYMVLHVTELGERLAAGSALKHLVLSSRLLV